MSGRRFVLWGLALLLVVVSGIQVAFSTHRVRQLHVDLQTIQHQRDRAVEEYSRLQLELASVAAYQNVERTAQQQLDMAFPQDVVRVER